MKRKRGTTLRALLAVLLLGLLTTAVALAADPVLTFVEVQRNGVDGVDGLESARSVTLSPDGKHLYSAGEGEDKLGVFSRNSTTGVLTFTEFQQIGVGSVLYR